MQLLVGERAGFARFAFPDECRFVAPPGGEVAIEAVVAQVDLAAGKPLCPWAVPLQNPLPGLEPVQLACNRAPELVRIFSSLLREPLILGHAVDMSVRAEFSRRRKDAQFVQNGIDVLVRRGRHRSVRHWITSGPLCAPMYRNYQQGES